MAEELRHYPYDLLVNELEMSSSFLDSFLRNGKEYYVKENDLNEDTYDYVASKFAEYIYRIANEFSIRQMQSECCCNCMERCENADNALAECELQKNIRKECENKHEFKYE